MHGHGFWKNVVREGAVLNPIDRISEVLFGLIMVLTFTGAISAATDGHEEVNQLLWAALGCNVAWGLVDAIMYLMNLLLERGRGMKVVRSIQSSDNSNENREMLRNEIQPMISVLLNDEALDSISTKLKALPKPEKHQILSIADLYAGLQIFLLVFLCTLPVALPFGIFDDVAMAMRTSNGVALLMLFIGGYRLAMYAGFRPWLTATAYAAIGILLVSLTMSLGG